MADQKSEPDRGFDESTLRDDFRDYHLMSGLASWAIVSESEQRQLDHDMKALTDRWHRAPAPWPSHWDHLVTAAHQWESDPQSMQRLLDAVAIDYARTGTSDLADPVHVRNVLQAGELVESLRTYRGFGYFAGTPDHIDFAYGYLTSYRAAGATTIWKSLSSWSQARRWLTDHAAATDPETRVDITITGPDPLSGAAARPLMTGTNLTASDLTSQLRRIDELLGTTPIPADRTTSSWLDDLRYDVLCEAYRSTLIDHNNPWAVGRKFEHYLRADDLHSDIADYVERTELPHREHDTNTGEERPDSVAARLAEIRRDVRNLEIDWATPPRTKTWLDDAVDDAQRRLDAQIAEGLRLTYRDQAQTDRLTVIGFEQDHWYLQPARTATSGPTIIYDTAAHTFTSCDELLHAETLPASSSPKRPPIAVPETIASQLRAFDNDLAALRDDLDIVRQLRDAVRNSSPYILRRPEGRTSKRPQPATRSATSRDANRITLTATPDSEAPTTPPAIPPRPKRRQPPKSTGRQHRRRL